VRLLLYGNNYLCYSTHVELSRNTSDNDPKYDGGSEDYTLLRWLLDSPTLRRVQEAVPVEQTILAHDGRPLLGTSVEAALDGINRGRFHIPRIFDCVVRVDDGLEFLDEVELGERRSAVHHLV